MKRINTLLAVLAVFALLLVPLSVISIISIRADPSGPVDAVVIAGKCLAALLGVLLAAQLFQVLLLLRRLDPEDEPERILETVERMAAAGNRLGWLADALTWVVVATSVVQAVRHMMLGDVGLAIFDLILAGVLLMQLRGGGGGGRRKSIGKLIGEKSRALVDRLVEVQKGMQPLPGPA